MLTFQEVEVQRDIAARTGSAVDLPLHAFEDLEANLRSQVARIRAHPWIKDVPVHGLVSKLSQAAYREVASGED